MDMIWVREAIGKRDQDDLVKWITNGKDNYVDFSIFNYPTTVTLAAYNSKPILHMPVQTAFILESLAINPEATKHEVSVGLREIVEVVRFQAVKAGIGEVYFLGTNEQTNTFATKHGFEELPWRVFRLRTYPPVSDEPVPVTEP